MISAQYQENLVTCPYNESHRILAHRFVTHLVKCRVQNKDSRTVACKFNASHIVPEPELKYHMDSCPDRIQLDNYLCVVEDETEPIQINFANDFNPQADEEVWEDDPTPAYNPQAYMDANPLLRRMDLGSKAVRKQFKKSERYRFQKIAQGTSDEPSGSGNSVAGYTATSVRMPAKPSGSGNSGAGNTSTSVKMPAESVPLQPKEKVPVVLPVQLIGHLEGLRLKNKAQPPPLSEILNTASTSRNGVNGVGVHGEESQVADEWVQIPVRGRGRGIKRYK